MKKEVLNIVEIDNGIGATWKIKVDTPLCKEDIEYIKNYRCKVYFNDLLGYWIFDFQLPSGRMVENAKLFEHVTYKDDEEIIENVEINAISTIDSVMPLVDKKTVEYMQNMIDAVIG